MTNFANIGAARDKVLQVRLDQAAQGDVASGTATSIDPRGYLTSLTKSEVKASEIPVADVARARELLRECIQCALRRFEMEDDGEGRPKSGECESDQPPVVADVRERPGRRVERSVLEYIADKFCRKTEKW